MEKAQKYQQARRVGRISLSDLIAKNIIEGESIPGAIGTSISQKFKARVTRFKEKFDPLNIASMLVGRSRLGTAILGRMMGRSGEDIAYFAKKGNRMGGSRNPFYTKIGAGSSEKVKRDDNVADVFAKVYNLMDRMEEQEKRLREIQDNFKEEQDLEEETRHKELLTAITGKKPTATKIQTKKEGSSIFDMIMSYLAPFLNIGKAILAAFGSGFIGLLTSIATFLASPFGLAIIGGTIAAFLATEVAKAIGDWETNKLREKGGDKAVEAAKEETEAFVKREAESPTAYNEFGAMPEESLDEMKAKKKGEAAILEKQTLVHQKMAAKGYPIKNTGIFGGVTYETKDGKDAPESLVKQMSDEADREIKQKDQQKATATPIPKEEQKTPATPSATPESKGESSPNVSSGAAPLSLGASGDTTLNMQLGKETSSSVAPISNLPSVPEVENIMKQNFELNLQESGAALSGQPLVINKTQTGAVNMSGGEQGTVTGAAPIRDGALGDLFERLQKRASLM